MEPIGLASKRDGELMIVHLCLNCGKISCNRVAGDDNSHVITCLLEKPGNLSGKITARLASQGIRLLTQDDKREVLACLFGYEH